MNPVDWEFNRTAFFSGVWKQTLFRGTRVFKYPTDLWVLAEIIQQTEPEVVVETGTAEGGSALWLWDQGVDVITIDIDPPADKRWPRGIESVRGDSWEVAPKVRRMVGDRRAMVVLDSDHNAPHVLREIEAYAPLVAKGCYLVVEDTGVDEYRLTDDPREVYPDGGPGVAVAKASESLHKMGFVPDPFRERYRLTMNPGGWLRRAA